MGEWLKTTSREAEKLLHEVITVQGLSYVDAIERLERHGEAVRAPYVEAAEVLRDWLRRHPL